MPSERGRVAGGPAADAARDELCGEYIGPACSASPGSVVRLLPAAAPPAHGVGLDPRPSSAESGGSACSAPSGSVARFLAAAAPPAHWDDRPPHGRTVQLLAAVEDHPVVVLQPTFSEADVKARLEDGRAQGRRLRRMVQRPLLFLGSACLVACIVMLALLINTPFVSLPPLLALPTTVVLLISILPTDRTAIVWVSVILALGAWMIGVVFAMSGVSHYADYRAGCSRGEAADLSGAPCLYRLGIVLSSAAFVLTGAAAGLRLLIAVLSRLPARLVLVIVWRTWEGSMLAFACANLITIVCTAASGLWRPNLELITHALVALQQLFLGSLTFRSDFRVRAQSWLASRGEAVTTAASIAALIGDRSAEEVQALALQRLRGIQLGLVSFDELTRPELTRQLFAKSVRCQLGQIDAFISHAWRDDARDKWEMVQRWRERFRSKYGREPIVWFDKACIEQDDIEAELMCLPVFLAGCSTLLVLFSESYLSRLWCVTELFVFLQMGGALDRIEMVAPMAGDEGGSARIDVRAMIDTFDVRRATCERLAERERLLTVIEVGFGGFGAFNDLLTRLLDVAAARRDLHEYADASPRLGRLRNASLSYAIFPERAARNWPSLPARSARKPPQSGHLPAVSPPDEACAAADAASVPAARRSGSAGDPRPRPARPRTASSAVVHTAAT